MSKAGNFALVLHTHFPYVLSHGRWPHGTDWLCEGATETYLPLLKSLEKLAEEGLPVRLTLSLSPVVMEQLAHSSFKEELSSYLRQKLELAKKDEAQFSRTSAEAQRKLAVFWQEWYQARLQDYEEKYNRDLIGAFRRLQDAGVLELACSAATHGYLPLLSRDTSVQAQVKTAVRCYERHFGRSPKAFWMPECAYRPRYEWLPPVEVKGWEKPKLRKGVDEFLSENGLQATFIESALLAGGKTLGVYAERFEGLKRLWERFESQYESRKVDEERSCYQAYLTTSDPAGHAPIAVFARDPKTGLQVWSGDWGYPGDGNYLDFHKKHWPGGLRYWAVTDSKADLADKRLYSLEAAKSRLVPHAEHFHSLVKEVLLEQPEELGESAVVCAMYDTELFGHWWFEGCDWLYEALKRLAQDEEITLVSATDYLEAYPPTTVVSLPEGSWGEGGFHFVWLNEETKWTWRHVYKAEARLENVLRRHLERLDPTGRRLLKQAARELLLLQSSDWQFLITTVNAADYGAMRFTSHVEAFNKLVDLFEVCQASGVWEPSQEILLSELEKRDDLFVDLVLEDFAGLEYEPG